MALHTKPRGYVKEDVLALALAFYKREYQDQTLATTVYVDNTTETSPGSGVLIGSDTNNGTSALTPFLTLARCYKYFARLNTTAGTIICAAGTYEDNTLDKDLNAITIIGNKTIAETRNITAATNAVNKIRATVDGAALTTDQWYGRLVRYTTLNRYGWVYFNNTSNQVFTTFDGATTPAVTTSHDLELYTLNTTIHFENTRTLDNCTQLNYQDLNFTGAASGRVWFFNQTDKVQFTRCNFGINRLNAGSDSVIFVFTCFIACVGDATLGMVTLPQGGRARVGQGTVFSSKNQGGSNRTFIHAVQLANINVDGLIVFRGTGSKAIETEASNISVDGGVGANDVVYFENDSSVSSNAGRYAMNLTNEGVGGVSQLPITLGQTTAQDFVAAKSFAKVIVPAGTSITTGRGTNTVSADGGSTNVSSNAADETKIVGGDPS